MWDITSKFLGKLPEEFKLYEDLDFLYLFYKEKEIARFSVKGVTVEGIENEAKRYLQETEK